ncbi:hypothetical protein O3G_MSEX000448 [Manduca sexta]|nr:hypothetical protein O3G_MSEX000448 [Manduca sexta]
MKETKDSALDPKFGVLKNKYNITDLSNGDYKKNDSAKSDSEPDTNNEEVPSISFFTLVSIVFYSFTFQICM